MGAHHTPGPWKHLDKFFVGASYPCINGLSALFLIAQANRPDEAEAGYTEGALNDDVAVANARLIAAAPDLLAAAERMVAATEADQHFIGAEHDALKAAIAKAKGA